MTGVDRIPAAVPDGGMLAPDAASARVMETVGAKAIAAALKASGIEVVFGYPGGGLPELIGPLLEAGVKTLAARTEISAAWMSYGYNRARHRAASACLFHEVGFLHTSPVVYAAKLDSTPLFVIGVNLSSSLDLREPNQEGLALLPSMHPISKYIRKVVVADDLPLAVRQAVLASSTGRFGPSVLELAFQVLSQTVTCPVESLVLPEPPAAKGSAVSRAWELICKAARPVLVVGGGVDHANGADAVRKFAQLTGIPVVSGGRGGRWMVPDASELYAGPLGLFGWTSANAVAQSADLWIAVGISWSQNTTAAWTLDKPETVIQVDIDPGELGKLFQPTLGIVADARVFLEQLIACAEDPNTKSAIRLPEDDYLGNVRQLKQRWRSEYESHFDGSEKPINQMYLVDILSEELQDGSIVIPDSGAHGDFLYRGLSHGDVVTPSFATTRYRSMGAGLPMAIGAKLAEPERTVVTYHGDGGFYYNLTDLSTLAEHNVKVIVIIDNNGCIMFNRELYKRRGQNPDNATWTELPATTDFAGIARSFGLPSRRVEEPAALRDAVRWAQSNESSCVLDVLTDPETGANRPFPNVIPDLLDRSPDEQAAMRDARSRRHYSLRLDKAWPQRG